ncbi:hypothetical protein WMF28_31205 [Sorangium sp. So ce590]|uniref:hypothetical protein n=1 Tax=Sorangium sp. So ce590 TaxID=3133317 RepID=UPI003F5EC30F
MLTALGYKPDLGARVLSAEVEVRPPATPEDIAAHKRDVEIIREAFEAAARQEPAIAWPELWARHERLARCRPPPAPSILSCARWRSCSG